MSGFAGSNTVEGGLGFAQLVNALGGGDDGLGSQLIQLLLAPAIVPGTPAGYQICKSIYSYHFLGPKIAEAPIDMAQSQKRELSVSGAPEDELLEAFEREWQSIGVVGADTLIHNTVKTSRIYGISAIGVGDRKADPGKPLDLVRLSDADLYFNVFDPLNTAGSLVLNQDPNSADFQKPTTVRVAGKDWHPSRTRVMMNEQPVYIEFTSSAFGFVGRSVYQRILYPLKTALVLQIADQWVAQKLGVLIHKAVAPGSVQNNVVRQMFSFKRQQIKASVTGNILTIGEKEAMESLNFQNLEGAGRLVRENNRKDIAAGAKMPAVLLNEETMGSDFHEGTEDAKDVARYIDRMRMEMQPLYAFFDEIVQRRAWSPAFYEGLQKTRSEYRNVPYETAFYRWKNAFAARWPNLLTEPDSKLSEMEKARFESVVAVVEVLAPLLQDSDNRAALAIWAADEVNSRKKLFSAPLELDEAAIRAYEPPVAAAGAEGEGKEPAVKPFSYES